MSFRAIIFLSALAAAGCAANPAPVPITTDVTGRSLILGKWSGGYFTSDGGRSGSIVFEFAEQDSTAHGEEIACRGDVVMVSRTGGMGMTADDGSGPQDVVTVLAIEFVKVTGHEVSGRMSSYTDPETGEGLSTSFQGRIEGDRIKGTLTTTHARSGIRDDGRWEITRSRN
jgi:hypothetical protein